MSTWQSICLLTTRDTLVANHSERASPQTTAANASTLLRRPITTDSSSFYFITEAKCAGLVAKSEGKEKSKAKIALNNMRKYGAAGRIMETDEGADAVRACFWCSRKGVPRRSAACSRVEKRRVLTASAWVKLAVTPTSRHRRRNPLLSTAVKARMWRGAYRRWRMWLRDRNRCSRGTMRSSRGKPVSCER